ncbi:type II secretion system F family protein [Vibrio sp. ZSDE26]|uniref:Type II secretion system F family protein n=1 Tax=Vibrio amylolyticus TaxID=2847292 RepID=A0A9X1XHL1_9VIBR|nr:type II secretion system F family protein [Vibrio amylolyticus]MCK6262466.1 type II secretion system F family protein [Vibrio amylolyticus]
MESIIELIKQIEVDEQLFILGFILLSTTLLIMAVVFIFVGFKSPLKKKLEEIKKESGSSNLKKSRNLDNTLESLAPIMTPKDSKERESVRHKLMHAGYHDADALTVFYAVKVFTFVIGLMISGLFYYFAPDLGSLNIIMMGSVTLGMFAPNIVIAQMIKARQSKIKRGVPDALDLLVVCSESGLGFTSALRRVADELVISHPEFADELDTVCAKIKAGVEMSDAFEDLVERTGVTEIMGLVKMLAHASRIGGSISQTLREYTEDFRDRRNQEIEEIAAKIPTKMIFPLLIFIWPCFFIVAIGPSMLSITASFGN